MYLSRAQINDIACEDYRSRYVMPIFAAVSEGWDDAYRSADTTSDKIYWLLWWGTYRYLGFSRGKFLSREWWAAPKRAAKVYDGLVSQSEIIASYPDSVKPFVFPLLYCEVDPVTVALWVEHDIKLALRLYSVGHSDEEITDVVVNGVSERVIRASLKKRKDEYEKRQLDWAISQNGDW